VIRHLSFGHLQRQQDSGKGDKENVGEETAKTADGGQRPGNKPPAPNILHERDNDLTLLAPEGHTDL
jgi:hypothetical protein